MQAVFYDFMTICANYTKTMVFFCAFCHMVSCLGLWCCRVWWCAVVWCGSVARCEALLASFYGFMVSSTSKALKWLCGRFGASGGVVSCCLVWCCGCLCGSLVVFWLCGGLWSGCASLGGSVGLLVALVLCAVSGSCLVLWSGCGVSGLCLWWCLSGCCGVVFSGLVFWCLV